jgi:3-oxoacyl-[acyl-carrier-protein] synthase II
MHYVPNKARKMEVRAALSNSFGLGGTNGTPAFKRYEDG